MSSHIFWTVDSALERIEEAHRKHDASIVVASKVETGVNARRFGRMGIPLYVGFTLVFVALEVMLLCVRAHTTAGQRVRLRGYINANLILCIAMSYHAWTNRLSISADRSGRRRHVVTTWWLSVAVILVTSAIYDADNTPTVDADTRFVRHQSMALIAAVAGDIGVTAIRQYANRYGRHHHHPHVD